MRTSSDHADRLASLGEQGLPCGKAPSNVQIFVSIVDIVLLYPTALKMLYTWFRFTVGKKSFRSRVKIVFAPLWGFALSAVELPFPKPLQELETFNSFKMFTNIQD